jgi:hypothetical protein
MLVAPKTSAAASTFAAAMFLNNLLWTQENDVNTAADSTSNSILNIIGAFFTQTDGWISPHTPSIYYSIGVILVMQNYGLIINKQNISHSNTISLSLSSLCVAGRGPAYSS